MSVSGAFSPCECRTLPDARSPKGLLRRKLGPSIACWGCQTCPIGRPGSQDGSAG